MDGRADGPNLPAEVVAIWQDIVDLVAALTLAPSVMINRLEPEVLEVFRSNAGPGNPFPAGTCMPLAGLYCEQAARQRGRLQVSDARTDPEWRESPTARAGIYSYLGYPLLWPDGRVFGTLCAVDTKANAWGERVDALLATFRSAIEAHLALVTSLDELGRRNDELERALGEVKALRGMLPICSSCKKIRDDSGYWNRIETYLAERADVVFTHGVCPDCFTTLYPGFPSDPAEAVG